MAFDISSVLTGAAAHPARDAASITAAMIRERDFFIFDLLIVSGGVTPARWSFVVGERVD